MSGPIVIAAGGTGGHLFPGQALAQELARRGQAVAVITDARVAGVGKRFPGTDVFSVPSATPSGGGIWGIVRAIGPILHGTLSAWRILGRLKARAVIGFGGYPTLPPLLAAWLRGIPTAVHEQNAVLGRVNRLMAPRVTAIAATFESPKFLCAADAPKLTVTGNPVRDQVAALAGSAYPMPEPGGVLRLLVFGGSQGARVMSDVVPAAVAQLPSGLRDRLEIVQQARAEDVARVREAYGRSGVRARVESFFEDMPERMAAAHLVIARAGASTVSELAVIGRPAILVPLPHAIDQDQLANAQVLAHAGGAWPMLQQDLTPDTLARRLERLLGDPAGLAAAAQAARAIARADAARRLADLVEAVASGRVR